MYNINNKIDEAILTNDFQMVIDFDNHYWRLNNIENSDIIDVLFIHKENKGLTPFFYKVETKDVITLYNSNVIKTHRDLIAYLIYKMQEQSNKK